MTLTPTASAGGRGADPARRHAPGRAAGRLESLSAHLHRHVLNHSYVRIYI
jgi:hypothetical protein